MDFMFKGRNESYKLRKFQDFLTERKKLCIMVLRQYVIGLHNYGLDYQKTLKKSNHSKFLRGK